MPGKKVVIAVTGASGAVYARTLMDKMAGLAYPPDDVAVMISEEGRKIWEYELGEEIENSIPFALYDIHDFYAPFASGSSGYTDMIICPCSMGTLGRIASGTSDNLIARSADVMLKEQRNLILVVREAPYNAIHLKNMQEVTQAGGMIYPASPAFYHHPQSLHEAVEHLVNRLLALTGLETNRNKWGP